MSLIRNIPYKTRMLAFATDSIPYYSNEKNDWICLSKKQLRIKIKELQKENKNFEISELLDIASDPEISISNESKNKSMRLSLDASIKLMYLALKNKKNKTDSFKTIIKDDLNKKISYYSSLKDAEPERISHLKKISSNWLNIKQDQIFEDFSLSYTYVGPGKEIENKIIDFIINHIRMYFKLHNVSDKDIDDFLSLIVDRQKIIKEEYLELSGTHELKIELIKSKPYLSLNFHTPPALWLLNNYLNYDDFLNDVPDPIKPLLDTLFGTEGVCEQDDISWLYVNEINIFRLKINFPSNNKILLENIDLKDEQFIKKVLSTLDITNNIDIESTNNKILDLTSKGKYLEAKNLQDTINELSSRTELFEYYLKIVRDLSSQVFSFSVPKNLLLLLDFLLHEKSMEERIFSWRG